MPNFPEDEEPTRPEGFRGKLRLMAERVLGYDPADIAVLIALRLEAIRNGRRGTAWHKFSEVAARFVDSLLK
jgi:hypothetical protein